MWIRRSILILLMAFLVGCSSLDLSNLSLSIPDDILDSTFNDSIDIINPSVTTENNNNSDSLPVDSVSGDNTSVSDTPVIDQITLSTNSAQLAINEQITLLITSNVGDYTVAWSTTDNSVASVVNGLVTGLTVGNATITASITELEISATCAITVYEVAPDATIKLNKTTAKIKVDDELVLTAEVTPTDAVVVWTSSDQTLATVNNGTVKALKSGMVTIKATIAAHNVFAECVIDIKEVDITGEIEVMAAEGLLESLYVEWKADTLLEGYVAYYKSADSETYKKVDNMLIRSYGDYYRLDVVGLASGFYDVKVVGYYNGEEVSKNVVITNLCVDNYVREGYAFANNVSPGAYNLDGTLKANARVIYITETNKDTVSLDVTGASANPCIGLQNIMDGYAKNKDPRPLAVRLIGEINDFSYMQGGDIMITGTNITLEGIGKDAVANGWGIRIKNSSSIEIRNIGTMLVDSNEGDNISLQQNNEYLWIHNNDLFYGHAGGDSDQAKGDGALDTKKSKYVTHSYNHFWDTGKSNLVGNGENTDSQNFLSFHHNWFDHSDSRHPRVRYATVHVYNNLYEGISKYGVGATMSASIFVESNAFINSKNPMLSSLQGTDALGEGTFSSESGGMIKAYDNLLLGTTNTPIYQTQSATSFDAIKVDNRADLVPDTYKTLKGGFTYNNFDTAEDMYDYTPTAVDNVESNVKQLAGRLQGGDFDFSFNAADATSYSVNAELKTKLQNYQTSLVQVGGIIEKIVTPDPDNPDNPDIPDVPTGDIAHNFSISGTTSSFFNINGNIDGKAYSVTYGDLLLTTALKLETSTSITFTTAKPAILTLVIRTETSKVKVDNVAYSAVNGVIVINPLDAGSHSITKGDSTGLLYIDIKYLS